MRRLVAIISLILCCLAKSFAQFSELNSLLRTALVEYKMDASGLYVKNTNVSVDKVNKVKLYYAYDVKARSLYALTDNSNCVIVLSEEDAKVFRKNKQIPQIKGSKLDDEILVINNQLDEKFRALNEKRKQFMADSIAKAKRDSIIQEMRAATEKALNEKKKQDYINSHEWFWVPVKNEYLKCELCDNSTYRMDSIMCCGIKNDSIYAVEIKQMPLGVKRGEVHKYHLSDNLKKNKDFLYHYEVFRDSLLSNGHKMLIDDPTEFNYYSLISSLEKVQKIAPYGFVEEWHWNDSYSMITFDIKYTNTNKKTIKYINVFFKVTNDVGDVRKTGNFQGTGPVEQWTTSSWDWDSSHYFVAGDATKMNITKIIITYMDGSQKVLSQNMIKYNDEE